MKQYIPTIGLEIHTELKTRPKMFCGCLNDPDEKEPNKNVCPVCLAHPGALPAPNRRAVESVLKLGIALQGALAERAHFDRKSYFYPDLPKGFQISQYDEPLVLGGELLAVRIRRIHLEEDTGRLLHPEGEKNISLVDYNRAGVPLMELVTEPSIKSGEEAAAFGRELQLILRYLGIASADMEKGGLRVEANVSVAREGASELGKKVEIKNLNSFKAVFEAVDYEIKRQIKVLGGGGKVAQETRGWSGAERATKSQRTKEDAHDYRYFPEPDIPPLDFSGPDFIDIAALRGEIPELPDGKRERFCGEYGLKPDEAELLVQDLEAARYFEEVISELKTEEKKANTTLVFNYLTSDLFGFMKERRIALSELKITPENFADLMALLDKGDISSRMAKDLIPDMHNSGEDPRAIIEKKGISQISGEEAIRSVIETVLYENKGAVEDYKKGKVSALQFLVGKTMAFLKGRGNPQMIQKLLTEALK